MRREDWLNVLLVAVIVALLVITAVISLPQIWIYSILSVVLIAATLVFAVLFLPWRPVARSPLPPASLARHLVFQLRREGFRVEEHAEGTTVRLDPVTAVRFRTLEAEGGSELRYQPYATSSGWGTLITLIVLVWTSVIGIVAIALVAWKGRRFARERLAALVVAVDSLPPPSDDIRVLLVDGLSEGHRLASEAYEAQRSSYYDTLAVLGVAGLAIWALVLFVLFFALPPGSPWRDWVPLIWISTLVAGAATAALMWVVRRQTRPRLLASRAWAERLEVALNRETAREAPRPEEPSSVELLLDTSGQISGWLQMKRWAGLSGDQAAGWVVIIVGFTAVWVLWLAVELLFTGQSLFGILVAAGGTGLAVAAYLYWGRWRRKQDEVIAKTLEEWRERAQSLRSRLDRFLQDL